MTTTNPPAPAKPKKGTLDSKPASLIARIGEATNVPITAPAGALPGKGAVEVFLLSGVNVLSQLIPGTALHGLGFIFKDYDQVWAAMDGEVGAHLRGLIEKGGLVVLDNDEHRRPGTTAAAPSTPV